MITRSRLESVAKESGFRPVIVEKVLRLRNILWRLDRHPTTEGKWLLKGGTALNILHLDVPRMSVDIDLNYVGSVDRVGMIAERPGFEAALVSICEREGCTVKRTPSEHAGGKFRLRFASAVGGSQNLEVDVSYVARVPLLGTERIPSLGEKLEEIRFPIGERDHRNPRRRARHRLSERQPPLGAFLLLDRRALQTHDLVHRILFRDRPACPKVLAQQPERHARGGKSQCIVQDQAAIPGVVALANRSQAPRLDVLAVGEENGVLHHQNRTTVRRHALDGGRDMRRENGRRPRLRIIKQTIRRLRARPITTRLVDRRHGRLGQRFGDFDQATIQTLVGQIDATKLLRHPLHRLRADLDDRLHLGIFTSRSSHRAPQPPTSHSATSKRRSDRIFCVQQFLRTAQINRHSKTCV